MIADQLHNRLLTKSEQEFKKMRRQRASDSYVWAGGCAFRRTACAWRSLGVILTDGGRARLPWVWEYKRKQRKIPKKEREKEKEEGFPDL